MISREQVLFFLREKQESEGGYTGNDLTELAKLIRVTPFGLRRRLANWIRTDKQFSQFIYLGKEKPTVTLSEFFKIEHELASNPIQVKKGIHEDIQEQRKEQNQKPLSKPTFYRVARQKILSIIGSKRKRSHSLKVIHLRKIANLFRQYSLSLTSKPMAVQT